MPEATILVNKVGRPCCPSAVVMVDASIATDTVAGLLQKNLRRNADPLKKLELNAWPACMSGMDIGIRQRDDIDMRAQFWGRGPCRLHSPRQAWVCSSIWPSPSSLNRTCQRWTTWR